MTAGKGFFEAKIASSIRGCIRRQAMGLSVTAVPNKRTAMPYCNLTEKPVEVAR